MSAADQYLQHCRRLLAAIEQQRAEIERAADWFAASILSGRVVHVFGSGHSRIQVEEMWPRYGSFPGFHPIVELSLTFHNPVVGANGQRQAMYLENVSGLAERILRNFDLSREDAAFVISSSGCNIVPIEMAEGFRAVGMKVVGLHGARHAGASASRRSDGKKLSDFCDLMLDTGIPPGDAMVSIDGLSEPVGPGSAVAGCMVVDAIKVEVASRLVDAGQPPTVLTAACVAGSERSSRLFETAYDQHAHRLARLFAHVGES